MNVVRMLLKFSVDIINIYLKHTVTIVIVLTKDIPPLYLVMNCTSLSIKICTLKY